MLRRKKGFTLIELLIVIAIIGILAAIAIPMYKSQTIKAKLTELTNSMSASAAAVAAYYQDNYKWPPNALSTVSEFMNTLGVSIPDAAASRISSVGLGANNGTITFTVRDIDNSVNNCSMILSPSTTSVGAIIWYWSGTIANTYIPKK